MKARQEGGKMELERDEYCFACGKNNPRGLKMDVQFDSQSARCTYSVPEELQGWPDITHGGIISTMLDEIMVWAAAGKKINTVTAELTVRFKKPMPTNKSVTVEGIIVEDRKRLLLAQARAFDEDNVYAEASAKLMKVNPANR